MKPIKKFGVIWILLFIFFPLISNSSIRWDSIGRKMNINMKMLDADFAMPTNFTELDSGRRFPCGDYKITSSMTYTIVNKDSTVRIGFSVHGYPSEKSLQRYKKQYARLDPNTNYIRIAKNRADTIRHKLVIYEKALLKPFNADGGGEYTRNCTLPYEDQYPYHRVIFIHIKNRGDVEITYFYKESAKDGIDEIVNKTAGLIEYRD